MGTLIIGALGTLGHFNNLPASVRFPTIKKISEICGIRVSPKNTHKSGIRVSPKNTHKAGFV